MRPAPRESRRRRPRRRPPARRGASPGRRTPGSFVHLGDQRFDARADRRRAPRAHPGSTTRNAWPSRGRLPSSTKNELASKPIAAPVSAVTSSSTIERQHRALGPAHRQHRAFEPGLRIGRRIAVAVERPAGGIGLPSFAATITLPRATSDSDRSMTSGAALARGNTAAIGLVPKQRPPAAGRGHRRRRIAEREADHAGGADRLRGDTRPRRSDGCWSRPTNATPNSRARRIASATASAHAGNARPHFASTSAAPPFARTISGRAAPSARPLREMRRVLRDARDAVRRKPARIGVDERRRGLATPSRRSRRRARARASRDPAARRALRPACHHAFFAKSSPIQVGGGICAFIAVGVLRFATAGGRGRRCRRTG